MGSAAPPATTPGRTSGMCLPSKEYKAHERGPRQCRRKRREEERDDGGGKRGEVERDEKGGRKGRWVGEMGAEAGRDDGAARSTPSLHNILEGNTRADMLPCCACCPALNSY